MHCVFSYDLHLDEGDRRRQIESQIEDILSHHRPNVRRLTTYYIVHIQNRTDWDSMLQELSDLSRSNPGLLHFIMSPPLDGGHYNGILPRNEWNDINAITDTQG